MTKAQALRKSIEHWERLVACETFQEMKAEGYRSEQCALCDLFYEEDEDYACEHCPVQEASGEDDCEETPYWFFIGAIYDDEFEDAHQAAQAELLFLKSLVEAE